MKTINKIIKVAVLAIFSVVLLGGPIFAIDECIGEGKKYPNLSTSEGIYCQRVKVGDEYISIYGKTSADCAQAGTLASDPDSCNGDDLNNMVKVIINTIIFVVGMKVKKGKDTILYGIIGLVIAILAYAIVNFILAALTNG